MQLPTIHTKTVHKEHVLYYCRFGGMRAFHDFVDSQLSKLSAINSTRLKEFNSWAASQIALGSEVFGKEVPDTIASLDARSVFTEMHLLDTIRPKIQSKLQTFLQHTNPHTMSTSNLQWNDRGIGVFSFAMASMGLFKRIPMAIGEEKGLQAQVEKLKIALQLTGIGSSVRKSYLNLAQKKGSHPALEVYVMAGANAKIEGEALYYVGIACAELTRYMESRGIPVAIYGVLATFWNDQIVAGIITLKYFEASLDVNQLLLFSSDPKYFRYRGCKALIALAEYMGRELPKGLGKHYSGMHQHIVDTITEGKGIAFGQTYSIEEAVKQLTRIARSIIKSNSGSI